MISESFAPPSLRPGSTLALGKGEKQANEGKRLWQQQEKEKPDSEVPLAAPLFTFGILKNDLTSRKVTRYLPEKESLVS